MEYCGLHKNMYVRKFCTLKTKQSLALSYVNKCFTKARTEGIQVKNLSPQRPYIPLFNVHHTP